MELSAVVEKTLGRRLHWTAARVARTLGEMTRLLLAGDHEPSTLALAGSATSRRITERS